MSSRHVINTVDGRNPAITLSHYLQGFIQLRWLFGMFSINSIMDIFNLHWHAFRKVLCSAQFLHSWDIGSCNIQHRWTKTGRCPSLKINHLPILYKYNSQVEHVSMLLKNDQLGFAFLMLWNFFPSGGGRWWFTMVQSVKKITKQNKSCFQTL